MIRSAPRQPDRSWVQSLYTCVCVIASSIGLACWLAAFSSQAKLITSQLALIPNETMRHFVGKGRYSFPLVFGGYFFFQEYRRRYTREKISRRSHDGNNNHQDSGASYSIADRCVAAGLYK